MAGAPHGNLGGCIVWGQKPAVSVPVMIIVPVNGSESHAGCAGAREGEGYRRVTYTVPVKLVVARVRDRTDTSTTPVKNPPTPTVPGPMSNGDGSE